MERDARSRPRLDEAYEKVALADPELDSDEGTVTPTAFPGWQNGGSLGRRKHRRTLLSTLWLCTRIVFLVASAIAWAASLWLTHIAARELGRARALIAVPQNYTPPAASSQSSHHDHDHDSLDTFFIPGGRLPKPGYGLVYNTSYCNGWDDPDGARARGCVLDATQGGWIHELCHDPGMLAEWLRLPDFGWYLDPHRTQRIAQEKVWAADIPGGVHTPLYTSLDFHFQHCKFVNRLSIKNGMRRNRGLGYIPLDPSHMLHCLELMTENKTSEARAKEVTQVVLGSFGGGTEGFGLGGECYMPIM